MIHGAELPRVGYQLPKTLPGEVFAQWIDPANLALLDERDRTIVLVLAFTGFRVSSVVTLMRDCFEVGSDGHPYLRYFNVKGSREAMLPIPPLLAEQLRRQQAFLDERFPRYRVAVSLAAAPRRQARRGHINPSTRQFGDRALRPHGRDPHRRRASSRSMSTRTCSATTSGRAWSTRTSR